MENEILLTDVILCSGCSHEAHADGECRTANLPAMRAAFGFLNCMCGRRITSTRRRQVNSVPQGTIIGDFPTVRGDRR